MTEVPHWQLDKTARFRYLSSLHNDAKGGYVMGTLTTIKSQDVAYIRIKVVSANGHWEFHPHLLYLSHSSGNNKSKELKMSATDFEVVLRPKGTNVVVDTNSCSHTYLNKTEFENCWDPSTGTMTFGPGKVQLTLVQPLKKDFSKKAGIFIKNVLQAKLDQYENPPSTLDCLTTELEQHHSMEKACLMASVTMNDGTTYQSFSYPIYNKDSVDLKLHDISPHYICDLSEQTIYAIMDKCKCQSVHGMDIGVEFWFGNVLLGPDEIVVTNLTKVHETLKFSVQTQGGPMLTPALAQASQNGVAGVNLQLKVVVKDNNQTIFESRDDFVTVEKHDPVKCCCRLSSISSMDQAANTQKRKSTREIICKSTKKVKVENCIARTVHNQFQLAVHVFAGQQATVNTAQPDHHLTNLPAETTQEQDDALSVQPVSHQDNFPTLLDIVNSDEQDFQIHLENIPHNTSPNRPQFLNLSPPSGSWEEINKSYQSEVLNTPQPLNNNEFANLLNGFSDNITDEAVNKLMNFSANEDGPRQYIIKRYNDVEHDGNHTNQLILGQNTVAIVMKTVVSYVKTSFFPFFAVGIASVLTMHYYDELWY